MTHGALVSAFSRKTPDGCRPAGKKGDSRGRDGSLPAWNGNTAGNCMIGCLAVVIGVYAASEIGGCCGKKAGDWKVHRIVKEAQKDVDGQRSAFQAKFQRDERERREELDRLAQMENELRPWADALRTGRDYEEAGERDFAKARKRFDAWLRRERPEDWDAILHAEKVAQAVGKRLEEMERQALARGGDVRDEPDRANLLARKNDAETRAGDMRKKLGDEFVKAEAKRYVERTRSLMQGDGKREGLEARIARLRDDVAELGAELERHLDIGGH